MDLNPKFLDTIAYAHDLADGMKLIHKYPRGVTVFGSARTEEGNEDYEQARELGRKLANRGVVITTGGGGGIMEAANRGALDAGGTSLGLNIHLPNEQSLNAYTTASHEFDFFFTRKQCLVDASFAFVYFPGGFGTLDELTEVLVQIQTKKLRRLPVICVDKAYWEPIVHFINERLLEAGMISPEDATILKTVDTVDEIMNEILQTLD